MTPRRQARSRREAASETERRALLEEGSLSAGTRWASSFRAELLSQGRAASGGWPGTMREARARVTEVVVPELRSRGSIELTPEEHEQAARATYAAARRDWLANGHRDDE